MAYSLPPLTWLRAFEAAARLGNFTRAAEELLITPAAVSYQVRQLEQLLGYPLFDRVHRELALTRLGQTYLPTVEKAFSDLSIATVSVFGERDRQPVRFRCLNSFGQLWMIPRLRSFQEATSGHRPADDLGLLGGNSQPGTVRHRYPLRRRQLD